MELVTAEIESSGAQFEPKWLTPRRILLFKWSSRHETEQSPYHAILHPGNTEGSDGEFVDPSDKA